MQFKAGYIVDTIAKVITDFKRGLDKRTPDNQTKLDQINGLLKYVSSFEIEFPYEHNPDYKNINPVLATLNNIITRGLPTRAPIILEKVFSQIGLTELASDEFEINYYYPLSKTPISYDSLYELLHIIEPGLNITRNNYCGNLGSEGEWKFLDQDLHKYPYAKQILQSQREFSTISKNMAGGRSLDFSFEFPYITLQNGDYKKQGVIFEYDGQHHKAMSYKYYDLYRDSVADESDFETLRQPAEKIELDQTIINYFKSNIFQIFKNNFEKDITEFLPIYSLVFIPLAIARIQKTLLEFLLVHVEFFEKEKITIAIIERDLPCGAVAVRSLQELFENINALLDNNDKLSLPEIELTIFETSKWVLNGKLHLNENVQNENLFKQNQFDITIDHSILRRSNIYKEKDFQSSKSIKIRSSHYVDNSFGNARRAYCADLLHYKSLVKKKDDGSYVPIPKYESSINFFIQNIFRKVSFREGQLPIISTALQQKPVIGLLPTGGGKSLTFQLPTFLQPGLCLVVDPIKSLMEDQVRVLKQNWIDCCDFINSNLSREQKVKKLIDFRYGETMFLFVSPERFVMEDFRSIISTIDISKFGLAFAYCVIDEVHCVSEWGHDFRSTYLMLGKNAQKFAKTRDGKQVSLIGLTATASFDVLADIERELQIKHSDVADAIIMIENTIRPELFFRVIDVTEKDRMNELNSDFSKMGHNLQKLNNIALLKKSIQDHQDNFDNSKIIADKYLIKNELGEVVDLSFKTQNDFYSIVFCPVKGKKRNEKGVDFIYENLNSNSKGYFYSSETDVENSEVQEHFGNFTNDKTKHIVCTKAFGMGIDKRDIRSTYHVVYSSSLESLVQEAGRSGRDRKVSEATVLVSKKITFSLSTSCLIYDSATSTQINKINDVFHRRSIRSVCKKSYTSRKELVDEINRIVDSFRIFINGRLSALAINQKDDLKKRLLGFTEESYEDRDVHDFFYNSSFKGKDIEYSQFYSLFNDNEFEIKSKLVEINAAFNELYGCDLLFKYWTSNGFRRLYITNIDEEDLGYFNITSPMSQTGNELFDKIIHFLKEKNEGNDDFSNLFTEEIIGDLNHGTLKETFEQSKEEQFDFTITSEKIYPDNTRSIFKKISEINGQDGIQDTFIATIAGKISQVQTFDQLIVSERDEYISIIFPWFSIHNVHDLTTKEELKLQFDKKDANAFLEVIYSKQIERSLRTSKGNFIDFLLLLEENIDQLYFHFDNNHVEKWLKLYYSRNRTFKPTNDTGRLIYRMHSMGFLEDYQIDYNKNNLYNCRFNKFAIIDDYIKIIEKYLRRYLSENTALKSIAELKSRLANKSLIEDIIKCLYFLSEFSYKEIASKRKRATDEIEHVMNTSITDHAYISDWYQQNHFIKEQIYFYFNAKYARLRFKINGEPYSLIDDHQANKRNEHNCLGKKEILEKYLEVFRHEGTEQNNYKHMMGSCKKIFRSLPETDLENEWLLRLLRAFAMYSVNNASYISEANSELELGFNNLYNDDSFHKNDYTIIEPIFIAYFKKLKDNLQPDNRSFRDIEMIRLKLLLKLQERYIDKLITQNQKLMIEYYA